MKKTEENKNSLGFIFGFKESEQNGNSIVVKFKSGISKKFPNKYKNFKDFYAMEILEGQTSDIYINPQNFKDFFNLEMKEFSGDRTFSSEQFEQRRYYFDYPISKEQYSALNSFSMAHLHVNMYEKWENDDILRNALKETVGEYFKKDNRDVLDIYKSYQQVSEFIYNKEISAALGEPESTPKKMKP